MASLSAAERERGVVTCSAGNHAQGVALAAKKLGIDVTIVMPTTTPEIKVIACQYIPPSCVALGWRHIYPNVRWCLPGRLSAVARSTSAAVR